MSERRNIIVPAVLERTLAATQRRITAYSRVRVPIQLDLMDGMFVREQSITLKQVEQLRIPRRTTAHLMVQDPFLWLPVCVRSGIMRIVVHVESRCTPSMVRAHRRHAQILVACNPGTPIRRVEPYVAHCNGVQVMTVNPGRKGSRFIATQLNIVQALRRKHPRLWIAVDGGLDERTLPLAVRAGANEMIVGSAMERGASFASTLERLNKIVTKSLA